MRLLATEGLDTGPAVDSSVDSSVDPPVGRPVGPSPLLSRRGAVASASEPELAWHYGDPLREQRASLPSSNRRGAVLLDRWNAGTIRITGPERLSWLHALASQDLAGMPDGGAAETLWLSPQGHIEHWADVVSLGERVYVRTEPGAARPLAAFLRSRVFRSEVSVADVSDDFAGMTLSGAGALDVAGEILGRQAVGGSIPAAGRARALEDGPGADGWLRASPDHLDVTVPRGSFAALAMALIDAGSVPAGTWAADALRIAARRPRFGIDNDARTIPNETPWLDTAVALGKGCYCGQEVVAKIDNLGHPPRRLALLNLDGSANTLPTVGADVVTTDGKTVGRVGTSAHHYEDGPIALALVKRTIGPDAGLLVDGIDASVDPDDAVDMTRPPSVDLRGLPNFRRLRRG